MKRQITTHLLEMRYCVSDKAQVPFKQICTNTKETDTSHSYIKCAIQKNLKIIAGAKKNNHCFKRSD